MCCYSRVAMVIYSRFIVLTYSSFVSSISWSTIFSFIFRQVFPLVPRCWLHYCWCHYNCYCDVDGDDSTVIDTAAHNATDNEDCIFMTYTEKQLTLLQSVEAGRRKLLPLHTTLSTHPSRCESCNHTHLLYVLSHLVHISALTVYVCRPTITPGLEIFLTSCVLKIPNPYTYFFTHGSHTCLHPPITVNCTFISNLVIRSHTCYINVHLVVACLFLLHHNWPTHSIAYFHTYYYTLSPLTHIPLIFCTIFCVALNICTRYKERKPDKIDSTGLCRLYLLSYLPSLLEYIPTHGCNTSIMEHLYTTEVIWQMTYWKYNTF